MDVLEVSGSPAVELGFFARSTIYRLIPKPHRRKSAGCAIPVKEWAGTELVFRLQPRGELTSLEFSRGDVIVGSGINAEISASLPLNNASSVGMGLGHYNSKTLYGERNVPSLEHGPSSTMLWVKMSLNY